jgi:acylphosphatase
MTMTIARHIRVIGRVQGVFYRAWTAEQARGLGITGWIRNCPDGAVEAHLSGEEQAVTALVERMRRGPPGAQVASLSEESVAPEAGDGFAIRRS